MSKKTNNLRKRLRVEAERIHAFKKYEAAFWQVANELKASVRRDQLVLAEEKKKAVALTIRLDQSQQFGDVLAITTTFRPEMFRHSILRNTRCGGAPPQRLQRRRDGGRRVGRQGSPRHHRIC